MAADIEDLLKEVQELSGDVLVAEAAKTIGMKPTGIGWRVGTVGNFLTHSPFDLNRALEWLDENSENFEGTFPCHHPNRRGPWMAHGNYGEWLTTGASPAEAVMRACVLVARMKEADAANQHPTIPGPPEVDAAIARIAEESGGIVRYEDSEFAKGKEDAGE